MFPQSACASTRNTPKPAGRWPWSQLPAVYEADLHPERSRAAFSRELEELERWFEPAARRGFNAVGRAPAVSISPTRKRTTSCRGATGNLCPHHGEWFRGQGFAAPKAARRSDSRRYRLASVRDHSVWSAIVKGWFQHLDPRRFALEAFYLGSTKTGNAVCAIQTSHFEEGAGGLRQWVEAVLAPAAGRLIYPDAPGRDSALRERSSPAAAHRNIPISG